MLKPSEDWIHGTFRHPAGTPMKYRGRYAHRQASTRCCRPSSRSGPGGFFSSLFFRFFDAGFRGCPRKRSGRVDGLEIRLAHLRHPKPNQCCEWLKWSPRVSHHRAQRRFLIRGPVKDANKCYGFQSWFQSGAKWILQPSTVHSWVARICWATTSILGDLRTDTLRWIGS